MMGCVCLLGHFIAMVVGTPFFVHCDGANGHISIEVAHVESCGDASANLGAASFDLQFNTNSCVDQSLGQIVTLRYEERSGRNLLPVAAVFNRIARPHMPVFISMVLPRATSLPDSASSLARNVILLI